MDIGSEFYNSVLDAISDAVIVTDPDGTVLLVNMAAMAITAYSLSELIGKNFSMIMEEGIFPESGEVSARTWGVWKHKSAREIPVYCNYRLVRDLRGNISSVVYVARDISDYKNTEEELIKAW